MILRYYADVDVREWHDHALRFLRTLHDEHGIVAEIDRVDEQHGPVTGFPGDIRSPTPEEVHEYDLKRNRTLNQTIDQTPSEAFKRCGRFDVVGNVVVVDDEGIVRWTSTLSDYANSYQPGAASQTAMNFLKDIATAPSNRIYVKCLSLLDGDENFCPNCGYEFS